MKILLFFKPLRLYLWLMLAAVLALAMLPPSLFTSGLDQAEAIEPYLNGNFPSSPPVTGNTSWVLREAFPDLEFEQPMHMIPEPGSNRLVIADKEGLIEVFENNAETNQKQVFLDLGDEVFTSGESGVGEFAFHPQYRNGQPYVYVFYKWRPNVNPHMPEGAGGNEGQFAYVRVSRFTALQNFSALDSSSEVVLIQQFDQASNHNGGAMFFGQDGYLYIFMGDEGGGGDNYESSQKINDRLFSGCLRIDVDSNNDRSHTIRRQPLQNENQPLNWPDSYTQGYGIPNDNPWLDPNGSILEEFYAIGLRNPYKAALDTITGQVWIGDVGQNREEEISLLEKGGNFQWVYREGFHDFSPNRRPDSLIGTEQAPVFTYNHGSGNNCILGGRVYRGPDHPELTGKYLYADNGSGRIWALTVDQNGTQSDLLLDTQGGGFSGISSFAADQQGRLYVLRMRGNGIYILEKENNSPSAAPQLLSETDAFTNLDSLTPSPGLIPYEPKISFWSDGADKRRWMAIPNNGTFNAANEQITFSENDFWTFPIGSVFIKHIELPTGNNSYRRLETRFMIRGESGDYYALTYRWLPDGSDARLLQDSLTEVISWTDANGMAQQQTWDYPSRGDCMTCHTTAAGKILGANARQLSHEITYPTTGRKGHQIATLRELGMFNNSPTDSMLSNLDTLARLNNMQASLELRARSYLDVNCAYCHRPDAGTRARFDARITTPLIMQGLINGTLEDNRGLPQARVVVPGDTLHSYLYSRTASLIEGQAMPPLAKNKLDQQGLKVLKDWIVSLNNPLPQARLRVILEGFWNSDSARMSTAMQQRGLLPQNQPFNTLPWNYDGTESAPTLISDIVDWVYIEIRDTTNLNNIISSRAALLKSNGDVISTAGDTILTFPGLRSGFYRVAIYHKSHIPVLSSANIEFSLLNPQLYNFTRSTNQAFGNNQQNQLGNVAAMISGDYDQNGLVNNLDFNLWSQNAAAIDVYLPIDADGNGIVNNLDFNLWRTNRSRVGLPELQK